MRRLTSSPPRATTRRMPFAFAAAGSWVMGLAAGQGPASRRHPARQLAEGPPPRASGSASPTSSLRMPNATGRRLGVERLLVTPLSVSGKVHQSGCRKASYFVTYATLRTDERAEKLSRVPADR